jgi:hypothetical protein
MSTLTDKQIAKIVDEMAELERTYKPLEQRFVELKKQLAEYANSQEDNDCIILSSDNNYITYTKPTYSLVCKDVQTFLAETKCFDAVTVSVSKAKDLCTHEKVAELFEYKKGSRKMLSIIPIASY